MSDRTGIEYRACHIERLLPTTREDLIACPAFWDRIAGYEDLKMSNGGYDIRAELVCKTPEEMLETCVSLDGAKVEQVAIEPLAVEPDPRNLDWQNAQRVVDEHDIRLSKKRQALDARARYVEMLLKFPA